MPFNITIPPNPTPQTIGFRFEITAAVTIPDKQVFDQLTTFNTHISDAATEFLSDKPRVEFSPETIYTQDPDYFQECMRFHRRPWTQAFMTLLLTNFPEPANIIDVGCVFGLAGLPFAHAGHKLTFHDFEGMPLEFVRWYAAREGLDIEIIPYRAALPRRYDLCVAFDVLEHTTHHFSAIRWLGALAETIAITYPTSMPYVPPYIKYGVDGRSVDEWIDDLGVMGLIQARHNVIYTNLQQEWRSIVFK